RLSRLVARQPFPAQRGEGGRALLGASVIAKGGARQIRMVRSTAALTSVLPSGEKAVAVTPSECPASVATCCRVSTFHSSTSRVWFAMARVRPSRENDRLLAGGPSDW